MQNKVKKINSLLKEAGLKVTPQRHAILEALYELDNHPTVEVIIEHIRKTYPGIATGTVYNVLDVMVDKNLVRRVKTDQDVMHYEARIDDHHHLYCADTERIEDYFDEELDELLKEYFSKKGIKGFDVDDIILQINGQFKPN